jgi:cold shock CspA family protein
MAQQKSKQIMGKGRETWGKKERENQKQKAKKLKEEKKKFRKENEQKGKRLEDMMAYVDENGNLSSKPPDPSKRKEFKVENIEIGVRKQQPVDPADLIQKGVVSFFNHEKGYGFIKNLKTGESLFVHINSCAEPISEKSTVTFEVEWGPKGGSAVNVKLS